MKINRKNYEEYFLLFIDGELDARERAELDDFLSQNPDLAPELEQLKTAVLDPGEHIAFGHAEALLKPEDAQPTPETEAAILSYIDNELDLTGKAEVERIMASDPSCKKLYEELMAAKLIPEAVEFPDKKSLYKKSGNRVVYLRWASFAAAAAVLGFIAFLGLNNNTSTNGVSPAEASIATHPIAETKKNEAVEPEAPTRTEEVIETPAIVGTTPQQKAEKTPARASITNLSVEPKLTLSPTETPTEPAPKPVQIKTETPNLAVVRSGLEKKIDPQQVIAVIKQPDLSGEEIDENSKQALSTALSAEQKDPEAEVYIAGIPVRKTPLRGIVRKTGRLLEKTANIGDPRNLLRREDNKTKN